MVETKFDKCAELARTTMYTLSFWLTFEEGFLDSLLKEDKPINDHTIPIYYVLYKTEERKNTSSITANDLKGMLI